jgi:hypothetical protein
MLSPHPFVWWVESATRVVVGVSFVVVIVISRRARETVPRLPRDRHEPRLGGLTDAVQERKRALFEQPGRLLVVVVQTRVGEQMAGTWV